jgi:hypothetical protein
MSHNWLSELSTAQHLQAVTKAWWAVWDPGTLENKRDGPAFLLCAESGTVCSDLKTGRQTCG